MARISIPGGGGTASAVSDTAVAAQVTSGTATQAALKAAFVASAGAGTSDDTARLNGLLAVATAAGGGSVKGAPGQTYTISAPLIIGSNTVLDMTGCTIRLADNSTCNMVDNHAATAARTVMDAVVTSGSTTLTSASAAFTSTDNGATVVVYGAGPGGTELRTTVTYVNATTATLATAPATSVPTASASVGPRDSSITILGGIWNRGSNGQGAGTTGHTLRFRRADGVTVRDLRVIGGTTPKYGVNFGDCTDFHATSISFLYGSDGVHVNGPCSRGVIRDISGQTKDDMVSLTPNDWTPYNDVWGDITDVTIENIKPQLSNNTAVKVLGGNSATASRGIIIRNVQGFADQEDEDGGIIALGDDTGQATTTGGYIDDITIENLRGVGPDVTGKRQMIMLNGRAGTVRIRGVYQNTAIAQSVLYVNGSADINTLLLEDIRVEAVGSGASVIKLDNSARIANLNVTNLTGNLAEYAVVLAQSANLVSMLKFTGCHLEHGAGFVSTPNPSTLDVVQIVGCSINIVYWFADLNSITRVYLDSLDAYNLQNGPFHIGNSGGVTVHTSGPMWWNAGKNSAIDGAGTLRSRGFGFLCDVSAVNSKQRGDLAFNTNAGLSCGVGPVVYTGTAWKSLADGTTY